MAFRFNFWKNLTINLQTSFVFSSSQIQFLQIVCSQYHYQQLSICGGFELLKHYQLTCHFRLVFDQTKTDSCQSSIHWLLVERAQQILKAFDYSFFIQLIIRQDFNLVTNPSLVYQYLQVTAENHLLYLSNLFYYQSQQDYQRLTLCQPSFRLSTSFVFTIDQIF